MGNVSRKAMLKVATPALVLSAAVLFSTGAHAAEADTAPVDKTASAKTPEKVTPVQSAFDKRYEAIKVSRNAIRQHEKEIDAAKDLEAFFGRNSADAKALKESTEKLSVSTEAFKKAVGDAVLAYNEGKEITPDGPKVSELSVLSPARMDLLKELGLDSPLDKSAKDFIATLDGKLAILKVVQESYASTELDQSKAKQEVATERALMEMVPEYVALKQKNIENPRGYGSSANPEGAWASGDLAKASGANSTAFGTGAEALGDASSAVGHQAKALGPYASAFGQKAEARGVGSAAYGYEAQAFGDETTAAGAGAVAFGDGATALGAHATALARGTASGVGATAGNGAVAIGADARAANRATAIGTNAVAVEGATAIGTGATANAKGAVAIGDGVVNAEANTVAFANGDDAKRLTHIADGKNDTDAVNVRQIRESAQGIQSTLRAEMDVSSQKAIAQSNSYTDQKVGEIRKDMKEMDRSFRRGIASSAALMMSAPYAPGKVAATAGTAIYRGSAAFAVGASYWDQSGTWNINGGIATAGGNSTIVRLGGSMLF